MLQTHENTREISERFWEKVDTNGPVPRWRPELGPCWLWLGALGRDGYGSFQSPGGWLAHHFVTGPVPEGMERDHLCRNRACVRPEHIAIIPGALNASQGWAARLVSLVRDAKGRFH
jgi:hypothetical protein